MTERVFVGLLSDLESTERTSCSGAVLRVSAAVRRASAEGPEIDECVSPIWSELAEGWFRCQKSVSLRFGLCFGVAADSLVTEDLFIVRPRRKVNDCHITRRDLSH